jgi:hypothetical protein
MVDLSLAFAVLRDLVPVSPPRSTLGTLRERDKSREFNTVRAVPIVPGAEHMGPPAEPLFCLVDVVERAAILEFDGGHFRAEAERLALSEFGLSTWDEIMIPGVGRAVA